MTSKELDALRDKAEKLLGKGDIIYRDDEEVTKSGILLAQMEALAYYPTIMVKRHRSQGVVTSTFTLT